MMQFAAMEEKSDYVASQGALVRVAASLSVAGVQADGPWHALIPQEVLQEVPLPLECLY